MENDFPPSAKSRDVQRAILAEMRGDASDAARHFPAAGHMELVLAADLEAAGDTDLAFRSRLSAGSCFWRAGQRPQGRSVLDALLADFPTRAQEIQKVIAELSQDNPSLAS